MIAIGQERTSPSRPPTLLQSWWVPIGIVVVGCVGIVGVLTGHLGWSQRPSLDFFVIVIAIQVLFATWVWCCSKIAPNWQMIVIVMFVLAHIVIIQLVRLKGFAGDGRPLWTWRWSISPQEAIDWNVRVGGSSTNELPVVDLGNESPHDYPSFRGRDRSGRVTASLNTDWQKHPPQLLWKRPLGEGWSSFVTWGDYCFTQEQRGDQEATVCYELRTGRECWAHYELVRFYEPTSGAGPRATPTIYNKRVYALGAIGILNCLDGANGHPWGSGDTVTISVHDKTHPASKPWGDEFTIKDEIYRFRNWQPEKVHVLMSLNMAKTADKIDGGTRNQIKKLQGENEKLRAEAKTLQESGMAKEAEAKIKEADAKLSQAKQQEGNLGKGPYHIPILWVKNYGEGKVMHMSLGHNESVWENETYQQSLLGGIKWIMNLEPGDATPNPELSAAQEKKATADVAAQVNAPVK